ncbi:glycosyltransferase family A protein [Microbacterium oxydans]|uniref:glycosyltransferase family A protein n=1 Tax=Microbacterium oxydans TaxID=82380 RepID=UPI000B86A44A|nr:glycosyltransferase family A protein [Microbacterium oxydans]
MTMATPAQVDVLVPVHSASRPVRRLAQSVLEHTNVPVRLLVVAHNIEEHRIRAALGPYAEDARVEVVGFRDGIPSPAGPMNFALDRVRAPWFTKIDSDDRLSPGALDGWVRRAEERGADAVLPAMLIPAVGEGFPTPPRRPGRVVLDPVRDRLSYRTSTMGLFSAALREHARPVEGLETGEDIAPSIRLWFGARTVVAAADGDAYLVGDDAVDRVTESARTLATELAFAPLLVAEDTWGGLGEMARAAVTRKLIRVHVLGALGRRELDATAVSDAASALETLLRSAPSALSSLSRLDGELIDRLRANAPVEDVATLVERRRRYAQPRAMLTPSLHRTLDRDAPLRFLSASLLAQRRARRAARAA